MSIGDIDRLNLPNLSRLTTPIHISTTSARNPGSEVDVDGVSVARPTSTGLVCGVGSTQS